MSEPAPSVIDRLRIFQVRGQAVVLDSALAAIYGVETKVFNQAIRRNTARFPDDLLFRLSRSEWASLRSQIVTLKTDGRGEHRKYLPLVFTEHGAIMAGTILNSPEGVKMSVPALVRLRNASIECDHEKSLPNPGPAWTDYDRAQPTGYPRSRSGQALRGAHNPVQ